MVIWKGYGILVLVIAIAIGALTSLLFAKMGSTEDMGVAIGAIISAIVIWFTGKKLNDPSRAKRWTDKQTGQPMVYIPEHTLFFLKMQYWAFVIGGIGLILFIDVLINGKSSF